MNKRRREILQAFQPVVDIALSRKTDPRLDVPIKINNVSSDTTEILIYGTIGAMSWWDEGGVTAAHMASVLKDITSANVHVRINSGGGDAFEGIAIHTLLSRHPSTVTTYIDGIAASAASVIAMAGDRIISARNAMMMIHDAMTGTYGNGDSHRRSADLLDKVSENIADLYSVRTGETAETWRAAMTVNGEDGTWYTGQEAMEAGLVDELVGQEDDAMVESRIRNALPKRVLSTVRPELLDDEEEPEDIEEDSSDEQVEETDGESVNNELARDQGFALLAAFHFGS